MKAVKSLTATAILTALALAPSALIGGAHAATTDTPTKPATTAPKAAPATAAATPAKPAETTLSVWLYDGGPKAHMATDRGMSMARKGHATMGIRLSAATVKAGEVTFTVNNTSKETVHELIVIPLKNAKSAPAFDDKKGAIDEEKAGAVGEVSELEPGKSGSTKLTLQPGIYMVVCNVPNHYANGMWRLITVTK